VKRGALRDIAETARTAEYAAQMIAGSKFRAAAYVTNMLNKQSQAGGLGLGAAIGTNAVPRGTSRMAALESDLAHDFARLRELTFFVFRTGK
jgi:hypothetical protein